MSNFTYSVFGILDNSSNLAGTPGEDGNGFLLSSDLLGYNMQGLDLDDVNNLDIRGCISNDTPGDVCINSDANYGIDLKVGSVDKLEVKDDRLSSSVPIKLGPNRNDAFTNSADIHVSATLSDDAVIFLEAGTDTSNSSHSRIILSQDDQVIAYAIETIATGNDLVIGHYNKLGESDDQDIVFKTGGIVIAGDIPTLVSAIDCMKIRGLDQNVEIMNVLKLDTIENLTVGDMHITNNTVGNIHIEAINGEVMIENSILDSEQIKVNEIRERTPGNSVSFANGLKTNDINERTGNNGVLVDSVLIKDGYIGMGHCIMNNYPPRYQFHATSDTTDDCVLFLESACDGSNPPGARIVLSQDGQAFAYSIESESDNNIRYRHIRDTSAAGTQGHVFNVMTRWNKQTDGFIPSYTSQGTDVLEMLSDTIVRVLTTLETNVINERTSAAGVTIDGLLIKDNTVTASNVTSTIINVDSIFENTTNAGVNVEGIILEDNSLLFDTGQTQLGHYSESSQANTLTGIWASDQSITLTFTKVGRMITMTWDTATAIANTSAAINIVTLIPIEYRPAASLLFVLKTRDSTVDTWGSALITNGGALTIYTGPTNTNFSGVGTSGVMAGVISYT